MIRLALIVAAPQSLATPHRRVVHEGALEIVKHGACTIVSLNLSYLFELFVCSRGCARAIRAGAATATKMGDEKFDAVLFNDVLLYALRTKEGRSALLPLGRFSSCLSFSSAAF